MIIILKQLFAILPLLIIELTVVIFIIMLSMIWRRNHFLNATLSVIGLNIALISLWIVNQVGTMSVTSLILVDNYSVFYTGLVLLASLATCTFAYPWLEGYKDNKEEFYLLILIATLGGILLVDANHMAALFLGIELTSLPLFGLIGYNFYQKYSLEGSIKYTILSAATSSFLLLGIALVYANTGNLSFIALSKSFNIDGIIINEPLLLLGLSMMIVALGFKLSLVPFHLWTPDVYQGAPAPVVAFLATAIKIAVFSVLVRLFLYVPINHYKVLYTILSIVAFTSMIFGNLMALNQINIKRMLGYSSISHIGYLMVALFSLQNSTISIETISIYLTHYMLSNLGAFGVISLISRPCCSADKDSIFHYRGLFWHHPILSMIMTVMMLSLAGIPMTLGFISKFYILSISIETHLWWLTLGIVIGSAIGLYYYLRVIVSLYMSTSHQQFNRDIIYYGWQYNAGVMVALISALLVLILGIYPQPLINIVQHTMPKIL